MNPAPLEFLHAPTFDPPGVEELAHEFLHPRKVPIEDRDHATIAIGPYCVVHKLPVFRLCKCFVPTELAVPEILAVTGAL